MATGYPHSLSVQNTKNATERAYETQKLLSDAGLNKGVALSMQSVDKPTLEAIKRDNISLNTYMELQRRFTRDKVETYSDLILGLPGETYESFVKGVDQLIENGQHNRIQFNNLSILPNAEMGDPQYQKKYGMVTIESRVVNIHGSLADYHTEEVYETQVLVIATASTPKEDWVRTRAFSWTAAFLHFDKVFQIPLVVLHEVCGLGYRELFELFCGERVNQYPVLAEVRDFFIAKARDIQNGGAEYCPSEKWLGIWWPADAALKNGAAAGGKLEGVYREAQWMRSAYRREH